MRATTNPRRARRWSDRALLLLVVPSVLTGAWAGIGETPEPVFTVMTVAETTATDPDTTLVRSGVGSGDGFYAWERSLPSLTPVDEGIELNPDAIEATVISGESSGMNTTIDPERAAELFGACVTRAFTGGVALPEALQAVSMAPRVTDDGLIVLRLGLVGGGVATVISSVRFFPGLADQVAGPETLDWIVHQPVRDEMTGKARDVSVAMALPVRVRLTDDLLADLVNTLARCPIAPAKTAN